MKTLKQIQIETKANEYINDNPEVFEAFVTLSKDLKAKGINTYSSTGVFEIMRFQSIQNGEAIKVSNDYKRTFSLRAMEENKVLNNFFNVQKYKTASDLTIGQYIY